MDNSERSIRDVQELILRATFLSGQRGIDAFQSWKSSVDLDDHLDLGSFRLLPELGRRLRKRGVEDPLLNKFAGISKKHWLANQLVFRDLEPILKVLRERAIDVMMPAEVALALLYYPDCPLDPLLSRVIVVPAQNAVTTFAVLEAAGWTPTPRVAGPLLDCYVSARSSHSFLGPEGGELRVHWHVLAQQARQAVDCAFWARATTARTGDETVAAASPTDLVVQLCAQRVARRMKPLFTRAVDVMMLLSACRDRIDWDLLIAESAKPGLVLPIRSTLNYLQDRLDTPVPAHVFAQIRDHSVPRVERLEYRITGRGSWAGEVLGFWGDYRRASGTTVLASAVRFPRFLQYYLKLPYIWQTPFRTLSSATGHLRRRIGERITRHRTPRDAPTPGR